MICGVWRVKRKACVFCCIVDKVRECHPYIIYIKIVFINNCRSKII